MAAGNDRLRTELREKFQPPIDVMLDPSLLVGKRALEQLDNSRVFSSQTQATLGRTPTEPPLGDLYVPETFHQLVFNESQSTVEKTDVWDFFRRQADAAYPEDVVDILDKNNVEVYSEDRRSTGLRWTDAIEDTDRQERLLAILSEEFSFLQSGGLMLSRTSEAPEAFRDAGVPTIDIGKAELKTELRETLTNLGYRNPANICSFGVSTAESTADALASDILERPSGVLLYQLGN